MHFFSNDDTLQSIRALFYLMHQVFNKKKMQMKRNKEKNIFLNHLKSNRIA